MDSLYIYLSLFATVLFGGWLVIWLQPKIGNQFKLLLSFSGAFLLAIAVLHIVPEVYQSKVNNIGIYVLVGFFIQLLLEFFSEGLEHGHIHVHEHRANHFPIMIMLSLSLHAFLEGMPLEREVMASEHFHEGHLHNDNSLLYGILFHKLPVSIALMTMFLQSGLSKLKSIVWLLVFASMAPLGTLLGHTILSSKELLETGIMDVILAIVTGMFLHISTTILFESDKGHSFNLAKLISVITGAAIAIVLH